MLVRCSTGGLLPFLFVYLFASWMPTSVFSQEGYRFTKLSLEEGLSNTRVNAIYQDSRGFIWVGTNYGLNRYNGYEFKQYINDPDDSTSISSNTIYGFFEDKDANLWVGTYGGINVFDRDTETFKAFRHDAEKPTSLGSNLTAMMVDDANGNYWIPTYGAGLNAYSTSKNTFTSWLPQQNDPSSYGHKNALSVIKDKDGVIWSGNDAGLTKLTFGQDGKAIFKTFPIDTTQAKGNTIWSLSN